MINSRSDVYAQIKRAIKHSYYFFLNLIWPPFCVQCKKYLDKKDVFCQSCFRLISPVVSKTIQVTKTKSIKIFAISDYKKPLRSLILAKSYSDIVAARQLGELIWDMTYIKNIPLDFLVPIPLHWLRFAKRGFNQANEIAATIARKSGKPVHQLLKRINHTKFQKGLKKEMRIKNLKDALQLSCKDKSFYKGKHLVLVDDLMTTGSTLKAAAKQLYKLQPASISAVVACRVL